MGTTKYPLYVAFIWHMHQPYYKTKTNGEYIMPWVRLHGIKDYYGMPHLIEDIPEARLTFSLTPSLLEQIDDYSQNFEQDTFINLTLKRVEEMTIEERVFILKNFFLANWETMVRVYPRYNQLLHERGLYYSDEELQIKQKIISNKDLQDLKMWHNLAWMDTGYQRKDERISHLIKKGKNFSQADIKAVVEAQKEIFSQIIPTYKRLLEEGRIELITTPYYHPILPLLCDLNITRIASPDIRLPEKAFTYPRDCRDQLENGIRAHESIFNKKPFGIWPSEGAVCAQIIPMLQEMGIQWLATDEDILAKSLNLSLDRDIHGCLTTPSHLYKPYWIAYKEKKIIGLFRDRVLSDLIGFVYYRWEIESSIEDFTGRLRMIHQKIQNQERPGLVSIILDGENAWEFYLHNGRDFLTRLYEALSKDQDFKMVTPSEYLKEFPPADNDIIENLYPGSWINHNFKVWIGNEEENTAWAYLADARQILEEQKLKKTSERDKKKIAKAHKELYIAEGSDWFWWYSEDHFTEQADLFDNLFREHLINFYKTLGIPVPNELYIPILIKRGKPEIKFHPQEFLSPTFDGKITSYYEWLPAIRFRVKKSGGTIHRSESILKDIYYGFDNETLYVRLDTIQLVKDLDLSFCLHFLSPTVLTVEITKEAATGAFSARILEIIEKGEIRSTHKIDQIAGDKLLEIGIPFEHLKAGPKSHIRFVVAVEKDENEVERWPIQGYLLITTPYPGYTDTLWEP